MPIVSGPLNNNECKGDFTHIARFGFAEINERALEPIVIFDLPAKGGVEMACVMTTGIGGGNSVDVAMGVKFPDPNELIESTINAGSEEVFYNTGTALTQGGGMQTNILAGSLPILVDATLDQHIVVVFDPGGPITSGEIILGAFITDPFRFDLGENPPAPVAP